MKLGKNHWYVVASFWLIGLATWLALLTGMGLAD